MTADPSRAAASAAPGTFHPMEQEATAMRRGRLTAIGLLLTATAAGSALGAPATAVTAAPAVTGGAPSLAALVDALLHALAARDAGALRRLRLTESEYRDVLLPRHVPPGEPLRRLEPSAATFAWANLDSRSHYHELRLLADFGGQDLTPKAVWFEGGEQQYAGYRAYRQLRVTLVDGAGRTRQLRTGSVAEIDGTFKFISFIRD